MSTASHVLLNCPYLLLPKSVVLSSQPNVTTSSHQPQPSSYPMQPAVSTTYQPRPCAPIYRPQLSPATTSYPPQAGSASANYPPQPSPVAASFAPQSTAFGYPPQPNPVSAAYPPLPQATQAAYPPQPSPATLPYPPQSSPSYNHHTYPPQPSPTVADTPQTEPKRIEPAYPPVTSPKAGQTPPIVHYVPVYAVQGPSGEQKYVAGPPINNPPADPSKVIPPPPICPGEVSQCTIHSPSCPAECYCLSIKLSNASWI